MLQFATAWNAWLKCETRLWLSNPRPPDDVDNPCANLILTSLVTEKRLITSITVNTPKMRSAE